SPLSGAPATVVTIDGVNFDSVVQNITVFFNHTPARVINASTKTISAIVPYGATTGPITVTVFGQSSTGPSFTVSPVPTSTNSALGAFNFIDAGVANGGTNLGFSNIDDSVVLAPLPFTFSLFRDIY